MKLIPMYEDGSCWNYCELALNTILATKTKDLTSASIYTFNDSSETLKQLIETKSITRINHETISNL